MVTSIEQESCDVLRVMYCYFYLLVFAMMGWVVIRKGRYRTMVKMQSWLYHLFRCVERLHDITDAFSFAHVRLAVFSNNGTQVYRARHAIASEKKSSKLFWHGFGFILV